MMYFRHAGVSSDFKRAAASGTQPLSSRPGGENKQYKINKFEM